MSSALKPCPACNKEVAKSAALCPHCGKRLRMGFGTKALLFIGVAAAVVYLPGQYGEYVGRSRQRDPGTSRPGNPIADIASATPSALTPSGEIYETFHLGTKATDVQRENLEAKIKGQIVQWTLPVYEVTRSDRGYRIQTSRESKMFGLATPFISTFVQVTARSPEEVSYIEGLVTGSKVTIKGRIDGVSPMRSIEIQPAIVLLPGSVNASAAPDAVPPNAQPIQAAGPSESRAVPAAVAEGDTRHSDPDVSSSPGEYSGEVVAATAGKLQYLYGSYFEEDCDEVLSYSAEVKDLNGDGQPEVMTYINGTCMGGMAGVRSALYVKDGSGVWRRQFSVAGFPQVLKSKPGAYPDIEIGGPGFCFPVWGWTGQRYELKKQCPGR